MTTDPANEDQDGDTDKYGCWYEKTDTLEQGSILPGARVFEETEDSTPDELDIAVRFIDAIVLTQSCDIRKPAQTRLLVAEVHPYREVADQRGGKFRGKGYRKELADGLAVAEFVVPPSEIAFDDWSIVNFRELYTIDRERLATDNGFVGLGSPYREHLGQAFARFMMRVGLPTGLDDFEKYQL